MTDDLVKQLRAVAILTTHDVCRQAADRIERLENLFPAILLYLEDKADVVDGGNGIPAPNRAMSLLVWTQHALEVKDG